MCMRLLVKILIFTGLVVIAFGFYVLNVAWLESTGGFRTSFSKIHFSSFSIEDYETKTSEIELENDTNYSFELLIYFDEPLSVSWTVLDPNGFELTVFDLRQLQTSNQTDQEVANRLIDGRFNSTISGKYEIIMTEMAGQAYSTDFNIYELSHLWMGQYKHFFNPAPLVASPFFIIGGILLLIGLIVRD